MANTVTGPFAPREKGTPAEGNCRELNDDDKDDDGDELLIKAPEATAWMQSPTSVIWGGTIVLLCIAVGSVVSSHVAPRLRHAPLSPAPSSGSTSGTVLTPGDTKLEPLSGTDAALTSSLLGSAPLKRRLTMIEAEPARRGGGRAWRKEEKRRRRERRASITLTKTISITDYSTPGAQTHIIPQGGSLAIECGAGTVVTRVSFASFGMPFVSPNGSVAVNPECHSHKSARLVEKACVGNSHCCLPVNTENFKDDPCNGKIKTLAVVVEGCAHYQPYTRFKRHCSLMGQPLLCDEDIHFLETLVLPKAPEPVRPHVAIMVDTSWRPKLQHYVVHNVHNHTGWPIQLFHGPSNGPKLKELFGDLSARGQISFTDLGSDYMEDWQRLSSMMLIDSFWEAVNGEVALVFQPDSVMCAASSHKIGEYVQYDYVGAPMAGPWWMTSDHDSQWSVGCGGFSLRNRAKAIQMCRTPQCITPAAGKLEDQQLGTMWKYLEKRCADAGIRVHKPSRFDAIQFAVEYDLQMDVLPGDDPARPEGCTANYYTGPEYDPGAKERGKPRKWNPSPKPAETKCDWPHFIPMGCHKCWRWNWRTWNHMKLYCPEAKRMREIRAEYKVGIEFTGWPTRPPVTPFRGPVPAHPDYLPVDMLEGNCKGSCKKLRPRSFAKTVLGKYHP